MDGKFEFGEASNYCHALTLHTAVRKTPRAVRCTLPGTQRCVQARCQGLGPGLVLVHAHKYQIIRARKQHAGGHRMSQKPKRQSKPPPLPRAGPVAPASTCGQRVVAVACVMAVLEVLR